MRFGESWESSTVATFDFETALGRIIELSRQSVQAIGNSRAFLIAVYGWPNHGKTYLMTRIQQCLAGDVGIDVSRCGGAPSEGDFQNLARQERDVANLSIVRGWIVLYHCGWEKGPNYLRRTDDPNALAQKILRRTMDLNVWIYNPKISNGSPMGEYDLIIRNPNSVEKDPIRV